MKKVVSAIEIRLFQDDTFRVDGEFIEYMMIKDIKHHVHLAGGLCESDLFMSNEVGIVLSSKANTNDYLTNVDFFSRIAKLDDVKSINVVYNDCTDKEIIVEEATKVSCIEVKQQKEIDKHGDLFILISKDKDIFDVFNIEI